MASTRTPATPRRRLGSLQAGAEHVGVSTKTLRRWGAQGRITLYRVGPRLLKVDLDELEAAILQPIPTVANDQG